MFALLRETTRLRKPQFRACQVSPGMQDPVEQGYVYTVEQCCELSSPVCSMDSIMLFLVLAQRNDTALHSDPASPALLLHADVFVRRASIAYTSGPQSFLSMILDA